MIRIDPVGMFRIAFAAEQMKAAVRGDAIDAAARAQHRMSLRPVIGCGIEYFDGVAALASKPAFESAADDINLAVNCVRREMISLRG